MKTKNAPAIIEDRLKDLRLLRYSHKCADEGLCAMEAAAYIIDAPHSDHPEPACPVIGAIVRVWNDNVDDETRQKLVPLLPRIAVSRSTRAVEKKRTWHFFDAYIRRIIPGILDELKLTEWAAKFRGLEKIEDEITARRSRDVISSFSKFLSAPSTSPALSQKEARALALDLALDLALARARALALDLALDLALALARALALALDLALDLALALALVYLPTLQIIEEALAIKEEAA